MTAASFFSTILTACNILKELEAVGLRVEVNTDFVAYRKMRDDQLNRLPIYPVFDVSSSFIDASNAFWICAFNEQNELCLLYTSPSPRDQRGSRMPSSA